MPGRLNQGASALPRHLVTPEVNVSTPKTKKTSPCVSSTEDDVFSPADNLKKTTPSIVVSPADPQDATSFKHHKPFLQHVLRHTGNQTDDDVMSPVPVTAQPPSWFRTKEKSKKPQDSVNTERIALRNYIDDKVLYDTLHHKAVEKMICQSNVCMRSQMSEPTPVRSTEVYNREDKHRLAMEFLDEYFAAINEENTPQHRERRLEVQTTIGLGHGYQATIGELKFGSKLAWRNSPRCIARTMWQKLHVIDGRDAQTNEDMFHIMCRHVRHSLNDGNIRSTISIFPARRAGIPDFRIWSPLIFKYAGYRKDDGTVIGDPGSIEFTEICQRLGWRGRGGKFDILPLVLQASGYEPQTFEIPQDLVMEVEISHPKYPGIGALGLRWTALPAVCGMLLECGGEMYPAAPMAGWFMSAEIACRNLGDQQRYNCLPQVAEAMGLDTTSHHSMWRDRAMVELLVAVQYSFEKAGVTIQDHHTLSEMFMQHFHKEHRERGGCPGDWVWLVPPVSGSASPLFHQEMLTYYLRPAFFYQVNPWKIHRWDIVSTREGPLPKLKAVAWALRFVIRTMTSILSRRHKVTILYGSETGRAQMYAHKVEAVLRTAFDVRVMCMNDYDANQLHHERLLIMCASTTGNGHPPNNALSFSKDLFNIICPSVKRRVSVNLDMLDIIPEVEEETMPKPLHKVKYMVFALGSRAYPNFCLFGRFLDRAMTRLGARCVVPRGEADEMGNQEFVFNKWAHDVFKTTGEVCRLREDVQREALSHSPLEDHTWSPGKFILSPTTTHTTTLQGISGVSKEKIYPCTLLERRELAPMETGRKIMLLRLGLSSSEAPTVSYSPGDHVLVWPENPEELVTRILTHLEQVTNPDLPVTVQCYRRAKNWRGRLELVDMKAIPPAVSLRTALKTYLNVTSPPTQELLGVMATLTSDDHEAYTLRILSEDTCKYETWVKVGRPNLAEVLEEFPGVSLSSCFLLTQLPVLQPRVYSISSSQACYPLEVHITASLLQYRADGGTGREHVGLCTGFMDSLDDGAEVLVSFRKNPAFYLPQNKAVPLILIAAGTGIAAFKGFWEQRNKEIEDAKKSGVDLKLGEARLYFGCRTRGANQLYGPEFESSLQTGALTSMRVALSREPNVPKTYVQDLLKADSEYVSDVLLRKKGHLYVCGDVRLSQGTKKALNTVLRSMGMEEDTAAAYILHMEEFGTYHEDIFGASLDSKEPPIDAADVTTQTQTEAKV